MPETRQARLNELLTQWRERSQNGETLSAADLCQHNNDAELLDDLSRLIHEVGLLSNFAGLSTIQEGAGKDTPSPDAGRPLPQIDGYKIERFLDKGGMGIVYKAIETRTNRVVALKMIKTQGRKDPGELLRFRREFEALAQLQHPNIVPMYHVDEVSADEPFFTMEYLPGGDLHTRIGGKPQDARESAALVELLARAVAAAHKADVIHRDLKPGNVLLTADGTPKIADFGLAKKLTGGPTDTTPGTILGTPSYAAPEQIKGGAAVDARADVYSLGAILYECLTGRPPFKRESVADTLLDVMTRPVTPLREVVRSVPKGLEAVCLKCLEKTPARRYQTAIELADELRAWQQGEPTTVRPASFLGLAAQAVCRRWVVATIFILALSGGIAAWLLPQSPDRTERNYLKQLQQGKPITLVGESGRPRLLQWPINEGGIRNTGNDSAGFSIHSFNPSLAQILPRTGCSHYTLSAQVAHDEGTHIAEVGLFVGLRQTRSTKGRIHTFCIWTFNDRVEASPQGHHPTLTFQLVREPKNKKGEDFVQRSDATAGTGNDALFQPIGPGLGQKKWRKLAVRLTPDSITPYWDGNACKTVDGNHLKKLLTALYDGVPDWKNANPLFDPDTPVGLYVNKGTASFKNIVIHPD